MTSHGNGEDEKAVNGPLGAERVTSNLVFRVRQKSQTCSDKQELKMKAPEEILEWRQVEGN